MKIIFNKIYYQLIHKLNKVFVINSPGNIKLSKTRSSMMIKLWGYLGRLLGPLLKTGLPLIKKSN